jgi:cysteine desulfurase/selenocysteine lyase
MNSPQTATPPSQGTLGHNSFDVESIRAQFPALHQEVYGKPLVYLDNSATSHKPNAVIRAVQSYYENDNSNVHRGVHALSERATRNYEGARSKIQSFINARQNNEIIYVRGTTEGLNLVAHSYVRPRLQAGDEIIISHMEHHSNIVPWQLMCRAAGAKLRVIPVSDEGVLDVEAYEAMLGPKTRFVSVVHVSNALGTINPVKLMTEMAHAKGVKIMLDGAQATPHFRPDMRELDCDFYTFSGHKMYGPTGIGALYGRTELLEEMEPYQAGGEMIRSVTLEETVFADLPHKFEAGTPNIAGAIGLGAAIDFITGLDEQSVRAHEQSVLDFAHDHIGRIPGVRLVGTAPEKSGVLSFVVDGIHAHDIGTIVDREGVAIRAGHHCAMPLMERLGLSATARASFALYNNQDDVERLAGAIDKAKSLFDA